MLAALGLFGLVEALGLAAAPLAALLLGRLPGAGLGMGKVLGMLLVTWLVWIAASLHAAHAELRRRAGDVPGAAAAYERAIALSENAVERAELERRLASLR